MELLKNIPSKKLLWLVVLVVGAATLSASYFFLKKEKQAEKRGGQAQQQKAIVRDGKFLFSKESLKVRTGEKFAVDILVDPGTHEVSNADLYLSYDDSKLKLLDVKQSEEFGIVLAKNTSTSGGLVYSAGANFGTSISSNSVYATLEFEALGTTGNALLSMSEKSGIYADDVPGENVAGKLNSLEVVVE